MLELEKAFEVTYTQLLISEWSHTYHLEVFLFKVVSPLSPIL